MRTTARLLALTMILLALLLSLCACDAISGLLDRGDTEEKEPTEGLVFSLADNGREYIVSGYTGEDTEIIIPSKHEGKKVTAIGANAFYKCEKIVSVSIPSSVKTIGVMAFAKCDALAEVTLPASVTSIGEEAFDGCNSLWTVTLSKSVETIGKNAFRGCSSILIYVENDTKPSDWDRDWNVGDYPVIWECKTNKMASDGYTYIVFNELRYALKEERAYLKKQTNRDAVTVSIPETVSYDRKSYSVVSIDANAFAGCKKMTEVTIPSSVTSIGKSAFSGCEALSSIAIPTSVKTIESYAFLGCKALKKVNIPNTVKTLEYSIFSGCKDLVIYTHNLTAPDEWNPSWNADGNLVVWGWNEEHAMPDGNIYTAIDGISYSLAGGKATVLQVPGDEETVTIPEKVTVRGVTYTVAHIADRAFKSHKSLREIVLPKTLESIGAYAFRGCPALASAELLASGVDIGEYAFFDCKMLTSVLFSDVGSIGKYAFSDCIALQSLVISSAESIGENAFSDCTALTSVTIRGVSDSIWAHAFSGCSALEIALLFSPIDFISGYVFSGCPKLTIYTDYRQSEVTWAMYWNGGCPVVWDMSSENAYAVIDGIIYALENGEATVIRQSSGIDSAIIPETVTYDGGSYTVTAIADSAFDGCSALTAVTIPDTVESIGKYAFRNCTALFSVGLGKDSGCKSIGASAFAGCSALASIVIPTSVTSFGSGVFADCTSLTIYTRHTSAPSGWITNWHCGCPVRWGVR